MGTSSGKFSDAAEARTYRQHFAKRWQAFIQDNFESAAHVFKMDPTTAANWWEGLNAPQGWVVGRAVGNPELQAAVLRHISEDAA